MQRIFRLEDFLVLGGVTSHSSPVALRCRFVGRIEIGDVAFTDCYLFKIDGMESVKVRMWIDSTTMRDRRVCEQYQRSRMTVRAGRLNLANLVCG